MPAQELQQPAGRLVYLCEQPPEEPPQLFATLPDMNSVPQVAEAWGVCPKTIRRLIARGELGCVHVGRSVRVTRQQMLDFVNRGGAHE